MPITPGTKCAFCESVPEIIHDTPTVNGPWAFLCPECFKFWGTKSPAAMKFNNTTGERIK